MEAAAFTRTRDSVEEIVGKLTRAARTFAQRARAQAGVELRALIDPDGEAVAALVDVEKTRGAAALATPLDLLLFETWVLGHLGDRDDLDLDYNTHHDIWFGLGAWIGEELRQRHGGFWLIGGDPPQTWRLGFNKVFIEIAPHVFAEKLIRSGQGLGKRLVTEIERIRHEHTAVQQQEPSLPERYTPQHYFRLHTVPLAQWLVVDMGHLHRIWTQKPIHALKADITSAKKTLPLQNAPVVEKIIEELSNLNSDKPAAVQIPEHRAMYEAVAQLLALRRASIPLAVDVLEGLVLPMLHIGTPNTFPPLDDEDKANLQKGMDLFSFYVEVMPHSHTAAENGLLKSIPADHLGTPYLDRQNLDVGKGNWLMVNPEHFHPLFANFDAKLMLSHFDRFVAHVTTQPNLPRPRDTGSTQAELAVRALSDLRSCLATLKPDHALIFRLLSPPG